MNSVETLQGRALSLVLDTNIVLDLFVYGDALCAPLREALADPHIQWLATQAMRDELERVLGYPQIVRRLTSSETSAEAILGAFDGRAKIVPMATKAPYTCKDADDQRFIDLAVAHQAILLSKDGEVLCMAKRLARLGVRVHKTLPTDLQAS